MKGSPFEGKTFDECGRVYLVHGVISLKKKIKVTTRLSPMLQK
jgi:hypothetical protein